MTRLVGKVATFLLVLLLVFILINIRLSSHLNITKSAANLSQIPHICPLKSLNGPDAILYATSQKHRSFILTGRKKYECVKLPHFNMCLYDKSSDNYLSQLIRDTNMWEAEITQSVSDALKMYPNAQLIDIGGFIGWHSFHAVATLNRSAVIVDPFVDNIYLMGSTLVRNNFHPNTVRLFPYCIYADKRSFNATMSNPGGTRVLQRLTETSDKFKVELNCATLDDLADCVDFTQAVMKIDIEQSEFAVFASNTSWNIYEKIDIPVVFMEWGHLITLPPNASKLVSNFFVNLGYSPYQGSFLNKLPLDKQNSNEWRLKDIFWVKPSRI